MFMRNRFLIKIENGYLILWYKNCITSLHFIWSDIFTCIWMYYEWSTCTATCGTEGQRMRIPGCFRVLTLDQHKTMGDRTSHSLYILQIQYWQYFGFTRLTNIFIPRLFMQTLIGLWQKIVILSPILICLHPIYLTLFTKWHLLQRSKWSIWSGTGFVQTSIQTRVGSIQVYQL